MAKPVHSDLDFSPGARILNLPAPVADHEPARKIDIPVASGGAFDWMHVLDADVEVTSTSFQDVTGLGESILANEKYKWWFVGHYETTGTTLHAELGINGPASPNLVWGNISQGAYATTLVAVDYAAITSYDQAFLITYGTNNQASPFSVEGLVDNGANAGTLIPRLASEAGAAVKVLEGSCFYGLKVS